MPRHLPALLALALGPACGTPDTRVGGGDGGGTWGSELDTEGEADTGGAGESGETGAPIDSAGGDGWERTCGNGILDPNEACDDGDTIDFDGCNADCTITDGVVSFSAGGAHTCAVSFLGSVRCFGANDRGQLGHGSTEPVGDDETPLAFGIDVELPSDVVQVSAGEGHTCALTADGAVYCWGDNASGQLGYGHTDDWGDDPGETPLSAGAVPLGGAASYVSAGRAHTCAVLQSGAIQCWGEGRLGQLGLGNGFVGTIGTGTEPYATPENAPTVWVGDEAHVRTLAQGDADHVCVADHQGAVVCWGAGFYGQLGSAADQDVGIKEAPGEGGVALIDNPIADIAIGRRHTCARTMDRHVQCWGDGADGQLGYGSTDPSGVDQAPHDGFIHLGMSVAKVTAGSEFTCALLDDLTVRCWGASRDGQLGYGSTDTIGDDEIPTDWPGFGPVALGIDVTSVDAGGSHVCARGTDSQLRCWGRGDDGRLGYGNEQNRGDGPEDDLTAPVPVFRFAP